MIPLVPAPDATATHRPSPYVTEYHASLFGDVAPVHVIPSVEYMTLSEPLFATATNLPSPYVTEYQPVLSFDAATPVQLIPSVEYMTRLEP